MSWWCWTTSRVGDRPDDALRVVELCGRLPLAGFRTARRSAVLG
ncbi:hypothetical protein O1L44_24450 [Streptomyces noursei]|nr:hypothetical protein [Streptomyces noursei]